MNPNTMELLFKLLIDYRDNPLVVSNGVACFTNLTRSADDNDFWTDSRIRYIIQLHDRNRIFSSFAQTINLFFCDTSSENPFNIFLALIASFFRHFLKTQTCFFFLNKGAE